MLLTEIASLVNIGANNQLTQEQVVLLIDAAQKLAFQRNLFAFLVYDKTLTLYTIITLEDNVNFVPFVESDIGLEVSTMSGGSGILRAYDNDTFTAVVEVEDEFVSGYFLGTTGGTGGGDITTDDQTAYKGPYSAPASPPCRKVWGLTTLSPGRFNDQCSPVWDYGLRLNRNPAAKFQSGDVNDLENTFLFSSTPSFTTTYYWVYWRNPPSIAGIDDDTNLLIPSAYHLQLAQCCKAGAASFLEYAQFNSAVIDAYLGDWLASLRAPHRKTKSFENMAQNPHGNPEFLI